MHVAILAGRFASLVALAVTMPLIAAGGSQSSGSLEVYRNPARALEERVDDLLFRMTVDEKIGQMTQVERDVISDHLADISSKGIGSILSGGGQAPRPNTAKAWADMVAGFQREALKSRLGIPLVYGVDAVHGHGNLKNAVIFPHNIGLGAARDADLVRRTARATAIEVAATGIRWDFAPVVAVVQDIRWGRTYESFGEKADLVGTMARAYLEGLQNPQGALNLARPDAVLGCAKHFAGDGGTRYGTSQKGEKLLDRGDTVVDEKTFRKLHLAPYVEAIAAGAQSIMVSYSSWNGTKMHAHGYLLTKVLKEELGFKGFLVSDWMALDDLGSSSRENIKTAVNAGLDMVMVPTAYPLFMDQLRDLIDKKAIAMARIDDAVRRILRVKFMLGLFENPFPDSSLLSKVGSAEHRQLAREAVAKTLVLLKNELHVLPLSKNGPSILVAGEAADDVGSQCGGWTVKWGGAKGAVTKGTTILEGMRAAVSPETHIIYQKDGDYSGPMAEVGVAVVAEPPYAEWEGDRKVPTLTDYDRKIIANVRMHAKKALVVLLSGRPLLVTDEIKAMDGFVAAWLPGSEGDGVSDVLFGTKPFTGRLPFTWPRNLHGLVTGAREGDDVLYSYNFGLFPL